MTEQPDDTHAEPHVAMHDATHDAESGDGAGSPPRWRAHALESVIGLVVALLLLWTAIAAVTDVPFVYQGL